MKVVVYSVWVRGWAIGRIGFRPLLSHSGGTLGGIDVGYDQLLRAAGEHWWVLYD